MVTATRWAMRQFLKRAIDGCAAPGRPSTSRVRAKAPAPFAKASGSAAPLATDEVVRSAS